MTNESLNSHLPTQVSQHFTRSPPALRTLERLLSPAPDLPQNRMAAHATQPNLPGRALDTLPCLDKRVCLIAFSSLGPLSISLAVNHKDHKEFIFVSMSNIKVYLQD